MRSVLLSRRSSKTHCRQYSQRRETNHQKENNCHDSLYEGLILGQETEAPWNEAHQDVEQKKDERKSKNN
jgi:hypothetical protein